MKNSARLLRRLDWGLILLAATLALIGWMFVRSATGSDARFSYLPIKQAANFAVAAIAAIACVLVPYLRIARHAWTIYGAAVLSLLALPWLGVNVNGATRWFRLPGFLVQPSEFAKIALILGLAAYLRFRSKAAIREGLLVPIAITAVPAVLILRQPDLGSSLVLWPVLLAMCWAAGASSRSLLMVIGAGAVALLAAYFVMHDYQRARIDIWLEHFAWGERAPETDPAVRDVIRGGGYQPWQSLIAIGAGGWLGFGLGEGPQNRYDFLPYRFDDYVFAVVAEETGWLGAATLLGLYGLLVLGLLGIARRTRERFGRLVVVGIAAYLGTQLLVHAAVCTWLVPATGLPLPLISYGGSATVGAALALGLALNVGARREPVLASDGFV
jgi:rod shape determining protein RodA